MQPCGSAFEQCSLTPDVGSTPPSVSVAGSQWPVACNQKTFVQTCDWQARPEIVGTLIYFLPPSQAITGDFPYACAPGIIGSTSSAYQVSAICGGKCPAGSYCPTKPTLQAMPCPAGHYCPESSSAGLPCPAGSYSNTSQLAQASDCTAVDPGHFAPTGSTAQVACAKGTYTDASMAVKDSCTPCTAGSYQDAEASTACQACDAGSYCPAGAAAPLPCPGGTHQDLALNVMTSVEDCVICPVGTFCSVGSAEPSNCAPGTYNDQLNASTCVNCAAGTYQNEARSTACKVCTPGYYCAEGSAAPLPCPGGTHKDFTLNVMTSVSQCITCPAGTSCAVGSAAALPCLPGLVANQSAMETCDLCGNGKFQRAYGQTACETCVPGFYCKPGAAEPVPCPAGYVGNATGLYSAGQCTPAARGFWAPLGSSIPEPCPSSGFYCPGALRDDIHGGAKPVIMPIGQSTETQEVATVQQTMTLDLSIDDFAAQREALIQRLAQQYNVDPSLITLEVSPARRRARALQSGGLELTITIATSDGSGNQVDISTIESAASAVDATTLAATISEVTVAAGLPPVSVTALQVPERASAEIEVPFACPAGKWCTAGLVVSCPLGTYNPLKDQDFATACILCPLNSYTSDTNSTSRAQCVCSEGFHDINASVAIDQALVDNLLDAGKDPVIMMADVIDCQTCPVGTDCSRLGATLEALPLVSGYFRLDNKTSDVRECPDARKNCSTTFGTSECKSASGCQGGASGNGCAPGLHGIYCELCDRSGDSLVFYRKASNDGLATCVECADTLSSMLLMGGLGLVALLVLVFAMLLLKRLIPAKLGKSINTFNENFTPRNKIKIILGAYQISTKIPIVYSVTLPNDINKLLNDISSLVTFGIQGLGVDSTPLECLGASGYFYKLIVYMLLPPVVILMVVLYVCISTRRAKVKKKRHMGRAISKASNDSSHAGAIHLQDSTDPEREATFFEKMLPAVLSALFVIYPMVTKVAFDGFPCYSFEDGARGWLIQDVSIECGTAEQASVTMFAWIAVILCMFWLGLNPSLSPL